MTKRAMEELSAASIARSLRAGRSGKGWIARCPAHDDHTPSLSIAESAEGRLLLHCFAGCAFKVVIAALERRGLAGARRFGDPPRRPGLSETAPDAIERRVSQIWAHSSPAPGSLVATYLRTRGLTVPASGALRFAPRLRHLSGRAAPAMLAAIRGGDARMIGLHRTWLRPDGRGKAALDPPRAMLGRAKGGAVRLIEGPGRLIVAEGIETALSFAAAEPAARIWASLSAGGMAGLKLPGNADELLIAADGDAPGRRAAQDLADRALDAGWRVQILEAPDGEDWNDVLNRGQRHGS